MAGRPRPSPERPRVCLVGPMPPVKGGVTTFMLNLMASPLRLSFEFVPYDIGRPPKTGVGDNYGYRSMLRGGGRRMLRGALVTLCNLLAWPVRLRRMRPDLVQVQASDFQSFWEACCYVGIARLLGVPVLMRLGGAFDHFYGSSSRPARALIRTGLRQPDTLIVQSAYWRRVAAAAGRSERVLVLNNFLLLDDPAPARRGDGPPVALFIAGSEARRKGTEVLLDALSDPHLAASDLHLRLVAAPPGLARRFEARIPASRIECLGPLEREEMDEAYRSADIFLLPSLAEGFPNSLLEAMAAGLACIATPVGAVPEVASDGRNAVLVPKNDAEALAGRLHLLATDRPLRERLGAAAAADVRARFAAGVVLPPLASAYRDLLQERPVDPGRAAEL